MSLWERIESIVDLAIDEGHSNDDISMLTPSKLSVQLYCNDERTGDTIFTLPRTVSRHIGIYKN